MADGCEDPVWAFVGSRIQNQNQVRWDDDMPKHLFKVQELMHPHIKQLEIRCEHKRNGQIFRGHPHYRGGLWNDWVIVDWGNQDGQLPCEIWCFVDLTALPEGLTIRVGECYVQKGLCAVVETTFIVDQEEDKEHATNSDFFTPIIKEVLQNEETQEMESRKFYLADVEAFLAPAVVVPDVGSECVTKYFHLSPRRDWAKHFTNWVEAPHIYDDMTDEE